MSGNARLSVVTWLWGDLFSAVHVNALAAMLADKLHVEHRLFCVTDDPAGIDGSVTIVPLPTTYQDTPRCRRRMQQWDREWASRFGVRMLAIDLDVVIVDDITPIVNRSEPIVGWKVGHAGVLSGSFVLADVGALHGAWLPFSADPWGYPASIPGDRVPSDQAMLNHYLKGRNVPHWTEADGFVSYYGDGYERLEHLGVGPSHPTLPVGARIVVLGSADLDVLHQERFDWVKEHWSPFARAAA